MVRITPLLISAALIGPALAAGTAQARPMTAEDVARIETVGSISVSPDGSRIAFTTSKRPDVTEGEENGGPEQQLKLTWEAGTIRDYLPEDMDVSGVDFSPDGRMISFLYAPDEGDTAVWGIPVDGGGHRKLAEVPASNVSRYAWASQGGTIYMLTGAAKDEEREEQKEAGFDAIVYEEELRYNRLFAATIGEEPDADPREIELDGQVLAMRIAPDGRSAALAVTPTPLVDDEYTSTRIRFLDLQSGEVTGEVATTGKIGDFEISPDGRQLSLIAAVDQHDPADTTLHLVDIASGQIRALNGGAAEAAVDAEWLPDGSLAAVIHKGAESTLRLYGSIESVTQEIGQEGLILTNVETGGGRLAVVAHTPSHPHELFVLEGGAFQRWTHHNPWLSEVELGEQRTMTYTARDGQAIQGILIEPVGGGADGGSPTIMMVHGGPESHYSNGWLTAYSMPGQVGAGKGYAVFHPNYRGSTAYGVDFAKQHQGNYAGKEFDDIVDAKRALVDRGIADPDRTGITGGSYGGFASAWGATYYSAEYAASVMFVGISNNVSKFGTTDIPNEMYLVHERKWPWEEWGHLMERSPITHVDKAETPLLILHGAEDPRVSPTQSMELYRHVKTRQPDTPVRLVLYPGEGHGNGQAAARYDYNLRMLEWFDSYLKTGDRDAAMPGPRPELPELDKDEAEE